MSSLTGVKRYKGRGDGTHVTVSMVPSELKGGDLNLRKADYSRLMFTRLKSSSDVDRRGSEV